MKKKPSLFPNNIIKNNITTEYIIVFVIKTCKLPVTLIKKKSVCCFYNVV